MTLPLVTGTNNDNRQVSVTAWNNLIEEVNDLASQDVAVDIRRLGCFAHEDSANFDNATLLNTAIADGVPLLIPAGKTFLVSAPLELANDTSIRGLGASSVLKLADSSNVAVMRALSGIDGLQLSSFKIDGNKANQTVGNSDNRGVYLVGDTKNVLIDNLDLLNILDHNIFVSHAANDDHGMGVIVSRCRSWYAGSQAHTTAGGTGGTAFAGGGRGTQFVNNSAWYAALAGHKTAAATVVGARSYYCYSGFETGFLVADTHVTARFLDFLAYECAYGMNISAEGDEVIIGNGRIEGSAVSGLRILGGVRKVLINGLVSKNNGQGADANWTGTWSRVADTTGLDGISIIDNASTPSEISLQNVHCTDDQATKTQEYGLYVEGAGTSIEIGAGCNFSGNKTGPVYFGNPSTAAVEMPRWIYGHSACTRNVTSSTVSASGVASEITLTPAEFPIGSGFYYEAQGTVVGTAAAKTIRGHFAGTTIVGSSQLAADQQDWRIRMECRRLSLTQWSVTFSGIEEGGSAVSSLYTFATASSATFKVGLNITVTSPDVVNVLQVKSGLI